MPGRREAHRNNTAGQLAKEAALLGKPQLLSPSLSRMRACIKREIYTKWERESREYRDGDHLRNIDNALPAKYTRRLYISLSSNRVYLLTQSRTGHRRYQYVQRPSVSARTTCASAVDGNACTCSARLSFTQKSPPRALREGQRCV
jgi:hypothetical protein